MQRFWDEASAAPIGRRFAVQLDGRPMRLPGRTAAGATLLLPGPAMAAAVVAEWQAAGGAKGGSFGMEALPLTRLAATAQDRIAPDPAATVAALAAYGEDDLLCYRAETPPALAERQQRAWQPWLAWAEETLSAPLTVTAGVMHVAQPPASLAALREALARHDPYALASLGVAVPALGSLVLGLALADGVLSAEQAHRLGRLDAAFQAELWGEDEEAAVQTAAIAQDIAQAASFAALARRDLA